RPVLRGAQDRERQPHRRQHRRERDRAERRSHPRIGRDPHVPPVPEPQIDQLEDVPEEDARRRTGDPVRKARQGGRSPPQPGRARSSVAADPLAYLLRSGGVVLGVPVASPGAFVSGGVPTVFELGELRSWLLLFIPVVSHLWCFIFILPITSIFSARLDAGSK